MYWRDVGAESACQLDSEMATAPIEAAAEGKRHCCDFCFGWLLKLTSVRTTHCNRSATNSTLAVFHDLFFGVDLDVDQLSQFNI